MGWLGRALGRTRGLAVLAFVLCAWTANAQSITDPTRVEFLPSVDHNVVNGSGAPVVQSYSLQIYLAGGTTPIQTVPLGKPALDPDGLIRVNFVSLLTSPLAGGVNYEGRVSANGPGGTSTSLPSNTFSFSLPSCAPSISPTSQSIAAAGGTGSTTVTAGAGCAWTAASNASWITVTSGASGSGNGPVGFSIGANSLTTSRTGTLTVAGATFTVTQSGVSCTSSISPTSQSFTSAGGSVNVGVTMTAGCNWTAASNNSWITISAGASGSGNGTVSLNVASTTSTTTRTGTVTIAGKTFNVTQTGVPCTATISPASQSFTSTGGSASVNVTIPAGCSWTAASNNGWMTVSSGASGSGSGTVSLAIGANSAITTRTGSATIAGQTFSVTQTGVPCTATISPASQSFTSTGGNASVAVTMPAGCNWTAASNNTTWITVSTGASGSGSGTVTLAIAANSATTARTGSATIAGQTFAVTQTGVSCGSSISPTSQSFTPAGGSVDVDVTMPAGCNWTATSNAGWITVSAGGSGSGAGTVSLNVAAYSGVTTRSGSVTIAGQTFNVTQTGISCTFTISATSQPVPFSGGTGSVDVSAPAGCAWTAASNNGWLTVTSGASGNGAGTTAFSASANPSTSGRNGTITIAGQTFTVMEAGAPCAPTISPASLSISESGGSGSASVTAATGCAWTTVANVSWITVTGGGSGSGPGTASFTINANSGSARMGTLTIGGNTFTVNQSAVGCSPTISPASQSVVAGGGTGTVSVTAAAGCGWTATSPVTWITITSGANGSGNGSVGFSAASNSATTTRSATLTIAGRSFTVNQAAAAGCSFAVTPSTLSVGIGGDSGSFTITTGSTCAWTSSSTLPWVSLVGSATGNGRATYFVTGNGNAGPRSGTITVAGQSITVNQAGLPAPPAPGHLRVICTSGNNGNGNGSGNGGCGPGGN